MTEESEAGFIDFVCQAMVCPKLKQLQASSTMGEYVLLQVNRACASLAIDNLLDLAKELTVLRT